MKFTLFMVLIFGASLGFANDVKDFNKKLIDDVQKDIKTDNDQNLKSDNAPMRGPASVKNEEAIIREDSKIEKKERQFGNSKW